MTVYYAVRDGWKPGIYFNKNDAEMQIKDYHVPAVRWFTNLHLALYWMKQLCTECGAEYFDDHNGYEKCLRVEITRREKGCHRCIAGTYFDDQWELSDDVRNNPPANKKCYVVFEGRVPGIYHLSEKYQDQLKGYSGAYGKAYPNFDAAVIAYERHFWPLSQFERYDRYGAEGAVAEFMDIPYTYKPISSRSATEDVVVYTDDGCCLGNGRPGARAGMGLYYGPDDHRNRAYRLRTEPQTNQRAELGAIYQALIENRFHRLTIYTDSQYAINCIKVWCKKWESNGYMNAAGKPVVNADLMRRIFAEADRRREAQLVTDIRYVPGHSGLVGNEKADELANEGALKSRVLE